MKENIRKKSLLFLLVFGIFLASCGIHKETELENPDAGKNSVMNGWVRGKVLLDNDKMLISGIIIENENGTRWHTTTDILAAYDIELSPGTYHLTFTRGPEYNTVTQTVELKSYMTITMPDIYLTKLTDLKSQGWISGDLHMHSSYSDGMNTPSEQLFSNISQGLHFGFLTDHNTDAGLQEWKAGNYVAADFDDEGNVINYMAFPGLEVTTQFGHYQSLGVPVSFDNAIYDLPDNNSDDAEDAIKEDIKNRIIYIAETIRKNGGIPQINHPFSSGNMGFDYWETVDYFDTIEIWNGVFVPCDGRYEGDILEQNYEAKLKWYELLNEIRNGGRFHAATCGTDNHDANATYTSFANIDTIQTMADYNQVYYENGRYSGVPTIYVYCPEEVTSESILSAVVAGHSFLSNGVTVLADVNCASYGDTAIIGKENILNLDIFSRDGLEKIQVIKNGEIVKEICLDGVTDHYDTPVTLSDIVDGDWIVLEVFGTETRYAITNPIFFSNAVSEK